MATNTHSNAIVLELLGKHNYANWSSWMKNYLLAQDLWDIVTTPPELEDEDALKQWRKNNAAALHAILISCEVDIVSHIREFSSAKIVWDELARMYTAGNPLSNSRVEILSEIREISSAREVWDKFATRHEPGTPSNIPGSSAGAASTDNYLLRYEALRTAINNDNLDDASAFLMRHPDARTAIVSVNGRTALHLAVFAGRERIVKLLVERMSREELEIKDETGVTALAQAAILQNTRIIGCMFDKNGNLLTIPDNSNRIPLIRALEFGNIEVARYLCLLYVEVAFITDIQASTALTLFIYRNNFDVALDWLQKFPRAAIVPNLYSTFPLAALASMSSAFPSGNKLGFWKYLIYTVLGPLCQLPSNLLKLLGINISIPLISFIRGKPIYEMKLLHQQANLLLLRMCKKVKEMNVDSVNEAIFQAVKGGVIEFIIEIAKEDPQLWYTMDEKRRTIFFYAVLHRQAKIFNLIYSLDDKNSITNALDTSKSTILHMAAMLEPSTPRDCIAGEALKMQSELQWFKEIERICPSLNGEIRNNTNMTARELFTHNHKDMMKEGEKWMKGTATSCTVVAALIMTIMFTASITVPGDNNQNTGFPIFLHKKLFMIFIICDAVSLFSSSTSVMVFLGILTSRYAEKDFLLALPKQMIIGLSTLFFSIATMMSAFCAGLFLMVPDKSWMIFPFILLTIITVHQFVLMQFPILFDMIKLTYVPSIGK